MVTDALPWCDDRHDDNSCERPHVEKNRVAVVTGSTSGIGLGVARTLATYGAAVLLNGFGSKAAIDTAIADVAARGTAVAYSAADMSKPGEIAAMLTQATRELGPVDVLVNNAGIQFTAPVEQLPVERWDTIFPSTRRRTSRRARSARPHEVVALETATTGITCNAVCPGWVLTPLVLRQIDDLAEREGLSVTDAKGALLAEKQPSIEFATPDQIGAAVAFLCSEAAAQIRGVALPVDGGWLAQ